MTTYLDRTLDADHASNTGDLLKLPEPHLVVLLECDRPLSMSSRHRLGAGGNVQIGRGRERAVERRGDYRGIELGIRVPDARMSSAHAALEGTRRSWKIRDAGSRNGVRVNGERVQERELNPGDIIELGHTLLLFVDLLAEEGADDLDAAHSIASAPGLSSLNPLLREQYRKLEQLAAANVNVLILGETGTGKEVTAQAVHVLSRAEGEFVGVNCGAIPQSLIEGELFGSTRGAFSGAVADRPGLIRQARGGTLFLDEIAELPFPSQSTFLRVLQEKRVRSVGGTQATPVEFRTVSATNQNIEQLVRDGAFRNDLFARIAGYRIRLPPLRERREDLGILIGALLPRIAGGDAEKVTFNIEAARTFAEYDFPLNIRELENWLTAAVALAGDSPIGLEHLPEPLSTTESDARSESPATRRAARSLTSEQQDHRAEVDALLREHNGNVSAVARATGKARNQIQRWMRRYNLDPNDYR